MNQMPSGIRQIVVANMNMKVYSGILTSAR